MCRRVAGKIALVVGAGQVEGCTTGNGRATALLLAREGASVVVVDRNPDSAEETAAQILGEGGKAIAVRADVTSEDDIKAMTSRCLGKWGRIDILHNNVGVGGDASGDAPVTDITVENFTRIMAVNLRGTALTCKHVIPVMRRQGAGAITNISSNAVLVNYPNVAYKASKAGVIALTEQIAITNASYGIRANVILPGLMETPMAIEQRVNRGGGTREQVIAERNARVPLGNRGGTAWDVAHAALFLSSDEAAFVTGTSLVVDGGQSLLVG